jgi:hypothetical protein
MPDAAVTPAELRPALQAKLSAAVWPLFYMREQEKAQLTSNLDPRALVAQFVTPARGVYATAETFAKGQSADFEAWYRGWLDGLTPEQRELWKQLRQCRVDQEHGAGPDLTTYEVDITDHIWMHSEGMQQGVPGVERPRSMKHCVRFTGYSTQLASAVMAQWLALSQRFADACAPRRRERSTHALSKP